MKLQEQKLAIALSALIVGMLVIPSAWTYHLRAVFERSFVASEKKTESALCDRLAFENSQLRMQLEKMQKSSHLHSGIPAHVVQRDPGLWDSKVWIDKGVLHDVKKNAPVVIGSSLVGVVETVYKRRALVRLITDSELPVSVQVCRGSKSALLLKQKMRELKDVLDLQSLGGECVSADALKEVLIQEEQRLLDKEKNLFLAKGIVYGRGAPLWRSQGYSLRGKGFNYDFADEQSEARDLRSGLPYSRITSRTTTPLIQIGDVLETTGLDGVFPKGLSVGVVSQVYPLDEGAVSYEIDAIPAAGSLTLLKNAVVLQPLQQQAE